MLLAYTAGVIAAEVPLLPAGLGVVETAVPAILRAFGVRYSTALAGALTYRAGALVFLAVTLVALAFLVRAAWSAEARA